MTLWFESVRRQFGSMTGAMSRRHGSGGTRRPTPAFVESLEDRCLLAAGDLDPSFGTSGKVTTPFAADAQATSMALQSDGKIVVVGAGPTNGEFALARYDADGALDDSFGSEGRVTSSLGGAGAGNSVSSALQSDGKIIVAGVGGMMARFNDDGSLDTTFGDGGSLSIGFIASGSALQEDGKILVAGTTSNGANDDFAVARFHSDGSPDLTFGDEGRVTLDFAASDDHASGITIQQDGKVILVGSNNQDFAVARFHSDGSLDLSFGDEGRAVTRFSPVFSAQATSLALQDDGKIVVAGYSVFGPSLPLYSSPAGNVFALARYNTDGSLDPSFDGNGKVTTQFENVDAIPYNIAFQSLTFATSLAVQSDGKIMVAGYAIRNSGADFALARFDSDGSLDTSFNDDGKVTTGFRGTGDDQANAIAIQANGRIVVAGFTDNEGTFEFALARYEGDEVSASVTLPESGGSVIALVVDGMLRVRRSRTSPDLVAPVALQNLSTIQFEGSNRNDRLTLDRSLSSFAGTITFNGSDGNDYLDAKAVGFNVTFNGGNGNDTLLGGKGDDTANGGAGNDSLSGSDGDDSLSGGEGNDRINGDFGDDTITGDAGADSINGGNDDDVLLGNSGRDTIDGGRGEDVIDGGDDNDNLKGFDGDDSIRGNNGNDTLSGGNGNDLLTGSAGNDSLIGDAGIDTLLGDDGNDKLNGGLGTDTINGFTTGPSKDTISDSTKVIDTSFAFDFDELLADLLSPRITPRTLEVLPSRSAPEWFAVRASRGSSREPSQSV